MNVAARLACTVAALGGVALAVVTGPERGRDVRAPAVAAPVVGTAPEPPSAGLAASAPHPRLPLAQPSPAPATGPSHLARVVTAARHRLAAPGATHHDVEPALRALARELEPDERERLALELAEPARALHDVIAAAELVRVLGATGPALPGDGLARLRSAAASVEEPRWRDAAARSLAALGTERDRGDLIDALRGPSADAARAARALRWAPATILADLAWSLATGGEAPFENHVLVLIEAAARSNASVESGVRASTCAALERARLAPGRNARARSRIESCLAALSDESLVPEASAAVRGPATIARDATSPPTERRRALYALGDARDPEAFEVLATVVSADPDASVRSAGLRALRGLPPEQRRPVLADAARLDPSAAVRAQAEQEQRELDAP